MAHAFDTPALYHWEPNTFSLKPLIVLNEKKIEFESRYTDFSNFEYASVPRTNAEIESVHNPEGEGPVLIHKGVAMSESFFICLYLDEAFPAHPMRPANAEGHWRVLMWARHVNEVLTPAVSTLGCHTHLSPALRRRDKGAVEAAIAKMPTQEQQAGWRAALNNSYSEDLIEDSRRKLGLSVKKIEDTLAHQEWLVDGAFSLADVDAFAFIHPAQKLAPDIVNGAHKTLAWLERIRSRPAVKAAFATAKASAPEECFTPGSEHSRWG